MYINNVSPVDISEFNCISNHDLRHKMITKEFKRRRKELSPAFRDTLKSNNKDLSVLAHNYGLRLDQLYAIARGRMFNLPLMKIGRIVNDNFSMSAQEFLFGYQRPVELPRSMQSLADHFAQLPTAVKRKLVSFAGKLNKQDIENETDAYHQSPVQLLRDRVLEYSEDHMIKPVDLCGPPEDASTYMRRLLSYLVTDRAQIDNINLNTPMTFSAWTELAVDYFISPNYLPYNEIFQHGTRHRVVYDQLTMQLLEQYLSCSKASQEKIFAKVLLTQK